MTYSRTRMSGAQGNVGIRDEFLYLGTTTIFAFGLTSRRGFQKIQNVKHHPCVNSWSRGTALLFLALSAVLSACSGAFEHASAEPTVIDESRPKITGTDAQKLQADFSKAQFQEQKQVRDRHAQELKDFIKQQKRDLDAYKAESTKRVKEFIGDHRGQGKEIRAFVR